MNNSVKSYTLIVGTNHEKTRQIFRTSHFINLIVLLVIGSFLTGCVSTKPARPFKTNVAYKQFGECLGSKCFIRSNNHFIALVEPGLFGKGGVTIYDGKTLAKIDFLSGNDVKNDLKDYGFFPSGRAYDRYAAKNVDQDGSATIYFSGENRSVTIQAVDGYEKIESVCQVGEDKLAVVFLDQGFMSESNVSRYALCVYDLNQQNSVPKIISQGDLIRIKRNVIGKVFSVLKTGQGGKSKQWHSHLSVAAIDDRIYLGVTSILKSSGANTISEESCKSWLYMLNTEGKLLGDINGLDGKTLINFGDITTVGNQLFAPEYRSRQGLISRSVVINPETASSKDIENSDYYKGYNNRYLFFSNDNGKTFYAKPL